MTDSMSIWIDGTPYDWDRLVEIVRGAKKNRKEPEVDMSFARVVYKVRWEDGETWEVSAHETSTGTTFFIYDPQGRILSETDPMYQELVDVVQRYHSPPYDRKEYGVRW